MTSLYTLAGGKKGALAFFSQRHRFPAHALTIARGHCIDAGTKRGNIGTAAKRNEVLSRNHQAAIEKENPPAEDLGDLEDMEDLRECIFI